MRFHLFLGVAFVCMAIPAFPQRTDVSAVAGGGFSIEEEGGTSGIVAVGASAGFPYDGRHRLQFDYMFHEVLARTEQRHFLTGSYMIQKKAGRTRPFFQIGCGLAIRKLQVQAQGPGGPIFVRDDWENALGVVLGGGATVDLGRSLFIRPQFRIHGHVGPTLTLLPSMAVGWRF